MAETGVEGGSAGAKSGKGIDLGKKVGGLPLGAWLGILGAAVLVGLFMRKKNAAAAGTGTAAADTAGYGANPQSGTDVTSGAGTTGTTQPTTNDEWAIEVINGLIAMGYDPALVDSSVRNYLAGATLDVREWVIVRMALAKYGEPPQPLPGQGNTPPPNSGGGSKPPPKPPSGGGKKPPPKPKPRPHNKTYRVVSGDTLWGIAVKEYGHGYMWPRIYNANRNVIHTPSHITPGMTLVIPA